MVAVDEARQHDLVAVADLLPGLAIQRLGDDGTAANEGYGHGSAPDLARTTCGVGLGRVVLVRRWRQALPARRRRDRPRRASARSVAGAAVRLRGKTDRAGGEYRPAR